MHTEASEIYLCAEAALEFLPDFHQWRLVQTSGSRMRCLFNSTQVQRASQPGLDRAEMQFLIKDALHHHTQAWINNRSIVLTPPFKSFFLTRELRQTLPCPRTQLPNPDREGFGKGRIWIGKQELCAVLWGHQNKPSKAGVPEKPHRSAREGVPGTSKNVPEVKIEHAEQLLSLLSSCRQSNSLVTPCLTSGDIILKILTPQWVWAVRMFSGHHCHLLPMLLLLSAGALQPHELQVPGMSRALSTGLWAIHAQGGRQDKNLLYMTQPGRTDTKNSPKLSPLWEFWGGLLDHSDIHISLINSLLLEREHRALGGYIWL